MLYSSELNFFYIQYQFKNSEARSKYKDPTTCSIHDVMMCLGMS